MDSPRPSTGDSLDMDNRPFTSAIVGHDSLERLQPMTAPGPNEESERSQLETVQSLTSPSREMETNIHQNKELLYPHSSPSDDLQQPTGSLLQLCLIENWGDSSSIGLTGVQVLGTGGRTIGLRSDQIYCQTGGQGSGVDVSVERLLDDVNLTSTPDHMWATPFNPSQPHTPTTLTVSLDTPTQLTGLRVWNYNASLEDSYRGVCCPIVLYMSNKEL